MNLPSLINLGVVLLFAAVLLWYSYDLVRERRGPRGIATQAAWMTFLLFTFTRLGAVAGTLWWAWWLLLAFAVGATGYACVRALRSPTPGETEAREPRTVEVVCAGALALLALAASALAPR